MVVGSMRATRPPYATNRSLGSSWKILTSDLEFGFGSVSFMYLTEEVLRLESTPACQACSSCHKMQDDVNWSSRVASNRRHVPVHTSPLKLTIIWSSILVTQKSLRLLDQSILSLEAGYKRTINNSALASLPAATTSLLSAYHVLELFTLQDHPSKSLFTSVCPWNHPRVSLRYRASPRG